MRNYKRLEFRSKQTEKAQLENFADMSKSLALLESFFQKIGARASLM